MKTVHVQDFNKYLHNSDPRGVNTKRSISKLYKEKGPCSELVTRHYYYDFELDICRLQHSMDYHSVYYL